MDWLRIEWPWLACAALSAAGLLQAALMLLNAWENRRYHRGRLAAARKPGPELRVVLFVPCKGLDVAMETNLRALFEQHYAPLELCFLIESESDAAAAVVRRLQRLYPQVDCRVDFTGVAVDCGQKVHNLMQGTQTVPATADILAFVDSDACPHRDWLAWLVDRLQSGKFAVATGYRWYVPVQPTFVNRLLSAINNTVVAVMGPHGFNLVWGGAWAIRASVFRKLGLPAAWQGSLSDDLVVSRLVREARLKVAYEPHCLVRTSADFTWGALAEFLRRQYLVVRVYAPTWWRFALVAGGLTNVVFWGLAGLAVLSSAGPALVARLALLGCYLLTALRGAISAAAVRPFVDIAETEYQRVCRINIWGWPLVSLVIWLGLVASGVGRSIVWRGIRYRLESPALTRILTRSTSHSIPEGAESHRPAPRAA